MPMIELEKDRFRKRVPALLEALEKRGFEASFFETADEARNFIQNQIAPKETVGIGGSITIREGLGMADALDEKGITVVDHWTAGTPEERLELKRKHRSVDVFLSSMNAITNDGMLVNLDGGGNRVASTCSGPKRVIVAAGANKVAESLDSAIDRTRNHASVVNAIRLKRKTPCVETGVCSDCNSPERICAALLILYKKPSDLEKFTVVLINEDMGY
jgi:L-lactate utilization protein LutB